MDMELRKKSGNIINKNVHSVGIIALGSYLENHGSALPIDTDIKISAYIGLMIAIKTGVKFLGTIVPSTEYEYVKHGFHNKKEDIIKYLENIIKWGNRIGIKKYLIINCHGGNLIIEPLLKDLEKKYNIEIKMKNYTHTHAATEEVSVGWAIGIVDETKLNSHNPNLYPEIGMVGLKEAREKNKDIDNEARIVEYNGVIIDKNLGKKLLKKYIDEGVEIIEKWVQ